MTVKTINIDQREKEKEEERRGGYIHIYIYIYCRLGKTYLITGGTPLLIE